MATSSETLRQAKGISPSAWAFLVVAGLIAVTVALGTYAIFNRPASEPAPRVVESSTVATVVPQEGALIKDGLQPRPYSAIAAPPEIATADTPAGFIPTGTDFRPVPYQPVPRG